MSTNKEEELQGKIGERMGRLVLFMVTHVGHLMVKKANREFVRSGFSLQIEQMPILFTTYFSGNDLLSQQEIADVIHKDKSGVQRSIRTLERDGYLRIISDDVDRRKNLIQLTPAGKMIVEKVIQQVELFDKYVTEQLSPNELSAFIATLQKISSIIN